MRKDEDFWLDRVYFDVDLLKSLLKPYSAEEMRDYPVPKLVGNQKQKQPKYPYLPMQSVCDFYLIYLASKRPQAL